MIKNKIPIYRVTIDEEFQEDQVLGVDRISNVSDPAIQIMGFAFSDDKQYKFNSVKDDLKLRIVAPVLVPTDVYRIEEDGEEFYLRFTVEDIEIIAKDFMSNLSKFDRIFTDNHGEEFVDSFIFEAIFVDSEGKQLMLLDDYNLDVPLGSFVVVQQFVNKEEYLRIVSEGKTGFSVEAYFGRFLIEDKKDKFNNQKTSKMKKKKFLAKKRVFQSKSKKKRFEEVATNEEIIVIVEDEFKEGEEISVIEEIEDGVNEDFTGEVEVENEDGEDIVLIIEDGVIEEVIEEGEEEEGEEPTEVVEEEMEGEEPAEAVAETSFDIEPLLDLLLEIKDEIVALRTTMERGETIEEDTIPHDSASFYLSQISKKFNK